MSLVMEVVDGGRGGRNVIGIRLQAGESGDRAHGGRGGAWEWEDPTAGASVKSFGLSRAFCQYVLGTWGGVTYGVQRRQGRQRWRMWRKP